MGVGRVGYFDFQVDDPFKVTNISRDPALDIGQPGTFDENGVMACSVIQVSPSLIYMYYVGFELGQKIRYRLLTGLAISTDGGTKFKRQSETPILERSNKELFFRGGPFCVHDQGVFNLWYVAGSDWESVGGKLLPRYEINYAESTNGIDWPSEGKTVISIEDPDEHGFGRPYVIKNPQGYEMFYSIRKRSLSEYRMGYATSTNGLRWQRRDSAINFQPSSSGFDSDAVMYGAILDIDHRRYMFYNGNEFGRDGVGLARLVK